MDGQMPIGNLVFSAGILYSGSSPAKVLQYFKSICIQFISIRTYNYIQSAYLIPSVRNVWQRHQEQTLAACKGKQVNIGGDGRCDSPGYCAKYGSYTCVDLETNKILDMKIVQVRSRQLLALQKMTLNIQVACIKMCAKSSQLAGVIKCVKADSTYGNSDLYNYSVKFQTSCSLIFFRLCRAIVGRTNEVQT